MEPEEREVGESVDPVAIGQIERSREKQRGRKRSSWKVREKRGLGLLINASLLSTLADLVVSWLFG